MTRLDVRSLAEANINEVLGSSYLVAVNHASIPFDAGVVSEFLEDKKSAQIVATNSGLLLLGWGTGGTISILPLTRTPTEFSPQTECPTRAELDW